MPPSAARSRIANAVLSSDCSPNVIVPRHSLETCRPLRPSLAWSIGARYLPPARGWPRGRVGALITITVPHPALTGNTGLPGEVGRFGILDHADTRDLVAA